MRRSDILRAWITAYGTATAGPPAWETVRTAASPVDVDRPSKATTIRYRD